MAKVAITVPDLGMQSEEIKFGLWLAKVGAQVEQDSDLFEIEADKATVVCEAPATGTLVEVAITEGTVKTGDLIGYLDVG